MLVKNYILNFLSKIKVKKVFLITGGAISFTVDAFANKKNIKYICTAHEQAAAMMADAYSRIGPGIAATMVTSGPGATNLITGIACSWFDSVPVIHITGQVNTYEQIGAHSSTKNVRQVGFQETNIVSMVKPITKFAYKIKNANEVPYILNKAYNISQEGRKGPVLIDIPLNIQNEIISKKVLKIKKKKTNKKISLKKINLLKKLLENSNRPVILIGGGIRNSNSVDNYRKILNELKIPIISTWSGVDLLDYKQFNYIGNIGVDGSRAGNFAVQNSDLLINFGSRLDTRVTGGRPETFARNAKIISVDIAKHELNKKRGLKNYLKFNIDLKDFSKIIISNKIFKDSERLTWLNLCKDWKKKYPICRSIYSKQKKNVNPYYFIEQLSEILNSKDIIIADDGAHLTWTMQAFKVKKGQRLFSAFGNSPMGYALPAAIGASIVKNKKKIICIDGDGSIQINIQDLQTAINHKLPIKIIIMNNNGYGIIKQFQSLYLKSRFEASGKGIKNPDFKNLAFGYGINYTKISNHKEISSKLKKVLNSPKIEFIDVIVSKNQKIIPKLYFGRPIEDLSPLLDRSEFNKNMIVKTAKIDKNFTEIN